MGTDRVSLRDVYNAVESLEAKMGKRFERIEQDIDGLESFQNKVLGIVAVLSVFGSLIATYIWDKVIL